MKLIKFLLIVIMSANIYSQAQNNSSNLATIDSAIFAMGCFWCAESEFHGLEGVIDVTVGYAGGAEPNPTYQNHSGYKEAIKIDFDPSKISYAKLLDIFWHNIDPFDTEGQFCDKGFAYTAVIYYKNDEQRKLAEKSKSDIENYFKGKTNSCPVVAVDLKSVSTYYLAEDYHQDYKQKNPVKYRFYRWNCGRDVRLAEVWG